MRLFLLNLQILAGSFYMKYAVMHAVGMWRVHVWFQ
jgi:hypothetical protein